ncbi:MAG TPA: HD domain-containing protein [Rhizomicrobium sp.]|jgi:predicted HD phosphohydrolase|nr:HD domain-containing protein [Rhizomicrobium sp.]
MPDASHERATFRAMSESTQEDWMKIAAASVAFNRELPDRVLSHLALLKGDCGGFAVDRLEHSLQSATLAHRDGMDEEYVVCALLHDMGDILASSNHAELGATVLRPFVSDENWWMLHHHGIFQGYYFFHHLGLDRNMREQFRGHPCFERTALFCARHDQNAFDPDYDAMPLEAFEPMVRRVMARPRRSIYLRGDDSSPLARAAE